MKQPLIPDTRSVARQIADAMRAPARPETGPDLTGLSDARLLSLQDQVIRALRDRPMRGFALDSLAVIDGAAGRVGSGGPTGPTTAAQAKVRLRIDDAVWTLDTVEAACLSIAVRLEANLRGADLFADAFALASREAEQKLEGLRRFGGDVPVKEG